MRELFPFANVIHLTDELPQDPSEHPQFWTLWRESLQRVLPHPPDYVFASENYGEPLAGVLSAEFIPVDLTRTAVPMSGTAIRTQPMKYWDFLPRCVRPYYLKRVCVFGPESTGKSTLTAQLATRFQTAYVPEYARTLIEFQQGEIRLEDMERIARGQIAAEESLARNGRRVLICDTDPLTTTIWSDVLFGTCPPIVQELAQQRTYDLYLLLDVDVPWVNDIVRYRPDERHAFFDHCRAELEKRERKYVVVSGDWAKRFEIAVEAVQKLIAE
jgi:NadR type nicotinamide-nucleotide adenylyltransferase